MPHRHERSHAEWKRIAPLWPPLESRGTYSKAHRRILNGILAQLQTGCPWRDLPERYGPGSTVASRVRRWTREGLWDHLLDVFRRDLDPSGALDRALWIIDGTDVRAHRVATGPGEKNPESLQALDEPADHALCQSRGRCSTTTHLLTDGGGLALGAEISAGQAHESRSAAPPYWRGDRQAE
jgi:transposase